MVVRATQIGALAASVLNRNTLPVDQPIPQPAAKTVKYGSLVMGLVGAQSTAVVPVPITPETSPTMLNAVVEVKTNAQRSFRLFLLLIATG